MGGRTIITYMFTTVIAVIIGLVLVNLIKPGNSISNETRQELIEAYSSNTEEKREAANKQKSAGPLQALEDIVPDNVFKSFTKKKFRPKCRLGRDR